MQSKLNYIELQPKLNYTQVPASFSAEKVICISRFSDGARDIVKY